MVDYTFQRCSEKYFLLHTLFCDVCLILSSRSRGNVSFYPLNLDRLWWLWSIAYGGLNVETLLGVAVNKPGSFYSLTWKPLKKCDSQEITML